MKKILLVIILTFSALVAAQEKNPYQKIDFIMDEMPEDFKTSTDLIANYISQNFQTKEDKIRASFYFTTSNINYDVENMFTQKPNQSLEEKVNNTLKSRKGVCMHYAAIFRDINLKLEIETFIVDGYTKLYGKIAELSHVWCAIKTGDNWFLYDPTWSSGFVNNNVFTKKHNNIYYKASPEVFIQSHMPFDYIWQFSNYPTTNQEFYDGKTAINKSKTYFDFELEITKIPKFTPKEVSTNALERITANGIKNKLIQESINFKNKEIAFHNQVSNLDNYKDIINDYNNNLITYNAFVNFRNQRFLPSVTDQELKDMIEMPLDKFLDCQNRTYKMQAVDQNNIANVKSFKKNLITVIQQAQIHNEFVKLYLTKDLEERKKMFYTKTVSRKN